MGDSSEELCVSTKRRVGLCSGFFFGGDQSFFVGAKSMGAPLSKTAGKADTAAENPGEAVASPTKSNGQVNDILPSSTLHPLTREGGKGGLFVLEGAAHRGRSPCVIVVRLNGDPRSQLKQQGFFTNILMSNRGLFYSFIFFKGKYVQY